MKIQKGIVSYKGRNDIVCMYGIDDSNTQYYFLDNTDTKKFSNGNRMATVALVEAVDPMKEPSQIGVIDDNGGVVIPFENKSIRPVTDNVILVEPAVPKGESVVEAIKLKNDPLSATKLVSTPAIIKEKINQKMGTEGRYLFNDQFSEATVCTISGENLVNGEYYSFIANANDKLYMSKNTPESEVVEFGLFDNAKNVESMTASAGSIDVGTVSVDQQVIENSFAQGTETVAEQAQVPIDAQAVEASIPPVVGEAPVAEQAQVPVDAQAVEASIPPVVGEAPVAEQAQVPVDAQEVAASTEFPGDITAQSIENNLEAATTSDNGNEQELEFNFGDSQEPTEETEEVKAEEVQEISEETEEVKAEEEVQEIAEETEEVKSEEEVQEIAEETEEVKSEEEVQEIPEETEEVKAEEEVQEIPEETEEVKAEEEVQEIPEETEEVKAEEEEEVQENKDEIKPIEENNDMEDVQSEGYTDISDISSSIFDFNEEDNLFKNSMVKTDSILTDDIYDSFDFDISDDNKETIYDDAAKYMEGLLKMIKDQKAVISKYEEKTATLEAQRDAAVEKVKDQNSKIELLSNKMREISSVATKLDSKCKVLESKGQDQAKVIDLKNKEIRSLKERLESKEQSQFEGKQNLEKILTVTKAFLNDEDSYEKTSYYRKAA